MSKANLKRIKGRAVSRNPEPPSEPDTSWIPRNRVTLPVAVGGEETEIAFTSASGTIIAIVRLAELTVTQQGATARFEDLASFQAQGAPKPVYQMPVYQMPVYQMPVYQMPVPKQDRLIICPSCRGAGVLDTTTTCGTPCDECNGTGAV